MSVDPSSRRPIGRGGLAVSALGLGCGPFGNLLAEVPDGALRETVAAARGAGVRYVDTAPFYGHGLSEHRLGECLRGVPRDSYVLSTKIGRLLKPDAAARTTGPFASTSPFDIVYDYSRDGALRSLEDSLQRLGLARIDIAYIHDVNPKWAGDALEERYRQAMEGAYRALERLRGEGVIGAIGVGVNDVEILQRFARDGDFDVFMLAGRYTLLDTTALPALLPHCVARGIAVTLAAPLASGILATGAVPGAKFWYADAPPEILDRVRRIEAVCLRHRTPLRAVSLQFPLAHPALVSVVVGMRSAQEVAENAEALRVAVPADLWRELRAEGLIDPAAPLPSA
ncbi:MAG: aldo/keto reductase [Alphaproteobacteria bacterium]|nr:aldo/keto reductase [Alphaproteobacteria bacterium]